jgi:hypothetical protein
VARLALGEGEVALIVEGEIAGLRDSASEYERQDRTEQAQELARQADMLGSIISEASTD